MDIAFKRLLLLLLLQFPLGVALFTVSDTIRQHPLTSALLALLYELALLLVAFGRKVWEQLEPELVSATSSWLRVQAANAFSRFRQRYNQRVEHDHRFFNTSGLRIREGAILELAQVFVELRIAHSDPQQARANPVAFRDLSGSQPIWEFLRRLGSESVHALAIVGAPGSGKTTLLQHVALTLAANRQRRYRLPAYTPVFLFLREHVKTILESAPPLAELLQAHFSDPKRYPELQPPAQWFARELRAGRCLLLLDGLDEVAEPEQRRAVAAWVDQQISSYRQCPFLITARPGGYREAPLMQAHVLEVQPFGPEQVRAFIHNWYCSTLIIKSGKRDAGIRRDAQREAEDLLQRLRERSALRDLTVNPLLLTMITLVHFHRGALPGSRVELYGEVCDVFLEHRQRAKHLNDPLNAKQKRAALQPLAALMMAQRGDENRRTISVHRALAVIGEDLRQVGVEPGREEAFLPSVQETSGLLLEVAPGQWSFAHLTFQEYLCAAHWEQTGELPSQREGFGGLVSDPWWHEALRLYAAIADATPIVEACLRLDTVESLTLAAEVDEESLRLERAAHDELRARLEADLESPDPARRRLAAEVRLNRRLTSPFRALNDARAIDTSLVTCAEYQLFLDERRAEGHYHQPDHWTEFTFPAGQAQHPILGIRYEDAEAFCEWLNARSGSTYRLPTLEETTLSDPPKELGEVGYWAAGGEITGLSSTPEVVLQTKLQLHSALTLPLPQHLTRLCNLHPTFAPLPILPATNLSLALNVDLGRALPHISNLAIAINHALDQALDRGLEVDRGLSIDRALDLILNRAFDLILASELDLIAAEAIRDHRLLEAHSRVSSLYTEATTEAPQRALALTLLSAALVAAQASTICEWRHAQRHLAMLILGYAYLSSQLQGQKDTRPWWLRWQWWNRPTDLEERQQAYLQLYWFFKIVELREAGTLPAWEGLRLVRETM